MRLDEGKHRLAGRVCIVAFQLHCSRGPFKHRLRLASTGCSDQGADPPNTAGSEASGRELDRIERRTDWSHRDAYQRRRTPLRGQRLTVPLESVRAQARDVDAVTVNRTVMGSLRGSARRLYRGFAVERQCAELDASGSGRRVVGRVQGEIFQRRRCCARAARCRHLDFGQAPAARLPAMPTHGVEGQGGGFDRL